MVATRAGTTAANARVSGHRDAAGAHKGADGAKLAERGQHWRDKGLSDSQTRHELQREGFTLPDIRKWLAGDDDAQAETGTGGDHPANDPAPAAPAAAPARTSTTRSRGGSTGGLLLAVVVYPIALGYLRNGPAGVKAWLRAKFLNQTATDPGINSETFFGNRGPSSGGGGVSATAYTPSPRRTATFAAPKLGKSDPYVAKIKPQASAKGNLTQQAATELGRASSKAIGALSFAEAQVGKPYKWGATGPSAFDCSGLMEAAYRSVGVKLPRTTYGQITVGRRVSKATLIPGDLVFPEPGHVQMYYADGIVIEAPHTGANVRNAPLGRVFAARRVA